MRAGLVASEVTEGLRRNLSMVVAVVLVTFVSLTFFGAAILMQMQIDQMKGFWYDRAQVAVHLCTEFSPVASCAAQDATESQIAAVGARLESSTLAPYIERIEFEDHELAYEIFVEQFAGSPIVDLASPEVLPQTFRLNLVDPAQSEVIIDSVSGMAGVEEVVDQRVYLDPIFGVLNAASYTAVGIATLMLVTGVLLIATTIRLSAFSRRRELGIMRLVGASNRFIQTPFVLEGVIASLLGSALASAAVVGIVHFFVQGYLTTALADTAFIGIDQALLVVPILFAVGAILAALSASVAIRRYLKV